VKLLTESHVNMFILMSAWVCGLVLILVDCIIELPSIHVSHQFTKEINMLLISC